MDDDQIIDALYKGIPLSKLPLSEILKEQYQKYQELLDLPDLIDEYAAWFMPESYQNLDIIEHLLTLCKNDEEKIRVLEELDLFEQSDSIMLLKYAKYLADVIKKNRIVLGPGRGSSCSLYCLYLLGLHKIDSIKYELSYFDFFKVVSNK